MSDENTKDVRIEQDSLGPVNVPANKLWGAQTQRALENFPSGPPMPLDLIHALFQIKLAAAKANMEIGLLSNDLGCLIEKVALEGVEGRLDAHFPLSIWQSGSGTQSNMNVNEVIANRAAILSSMEPGKKDPVHPNDHVNRCQSTNDIVPAAMQMVAVRKLVGELVPELDDVREDLARKAEQWDHVVKIGRTHLMDAVPLTLGQEFSGYAAQLDDALDHLRRCADALYALPLGGTAVGTGLNAPGTFGELAVRQLAEMTGLPFVVAPNMYSRMAAHNSLTALSGAMRVAASALMKIANDIRWLGSGPDCGLGELELPVNEPGSSIMPGKVNPTQCEALCMICVQVMGLDAAIGFADSQGNFELNVYKPIIAYDVLFSLDSLAKGLRSFREKTLSGLQANSSKIKEYVGKSLMLATALVPVIGYDDAARVAQHARKRGITLKMACSELQILTEEEFEQQIRPENMTGPLL
ncbi:class II fumarate hydratase [Desulfobaculum bizertense]|uniref:Fumarate hydratase class II n=1 Tax=Desulfobaculum bizertense DSM 18034 TaxID=1121442 RepID=A0A1T4VJZ9_9BACT|nr:class II fumarate hydratase [Desulfobaculum bizertense]UIJ38044.1 class II fumarate hydratase [Desulfobaculum bizertense]SKA65269.1 fumarase, class II [Desulfobaculum bizertense DSM 18034]